MFIGVVALMQSFKAVIEQRYGVSQRAATVEVIPWLIAMPSSRNRQHRSTGRIWPIARVQHHGRKRPYGFARNDDRMTGIDSAC